MRNLALSVAVALAYIAGPLVGGVVIFIGATAAIVFAAPPPTRDHIEPAPEVATPHLRAAVGHVGAVVDGAVVGPAVAGSIAPAFDFTCTTTGQLITDGGASYREIAVWNAACSAGTCTPSATPVFIGAPTVTNSTGQPICNTTGCVSQTVDLEVSGAGCVVTAGTVHVTAMVIR